MAYNPSLDVLRVLAVFLVMAFHARLPGFTGGWLGVDLFFVLSGFLITSSLLSEQEQTGCINLRQFYIRRFRRLTPALYAMLLAYIAFMAWKGLGTKAATDAAPMFLYLSSYTIPIDWPTHLSHTWSLAVEEHFYLLWPLTLLLIFRTPTDARAVLLVLYVAATASRIWAALYDTWFDAYYTTHARLSGLILGASAAYLLRQYRGRSFAVSGASLYAASVYFASWSHDASLAFNVLVAEWGALALVLACWNNPGLLSQTRLAWLGKYTYGIYLWHYPIMVMLRGPDVSPYFIMTIGGAASVLLAFLSYHTVEAYFRSKRLKRSDRVETPRSQDVQGLGRDPVR